MLPSPSIYMNPYASLISKEKLSYLLGQFELAGLIQKSLEIQAGPGGNPAVFSRGGITTPGYGSRHVGSMPYRIIG